jgi:hypothetical protein
MSDNDNCFRDIGVAYAELTASSKSDLPVTWYVLPIAKSSPDLQSSMFVSANKVQASLSSNFGSLKSTGPSKLFMTISMEASAPRFRNPDFCA